MQCRLFVDFADYNYSPQVAVNIASINYL